MQIRQIVDLRTMIFVIKTKITYFKIVKSQYLCEIFLGKISSKI